MHSNYESGYVDDRRHFISQIISQKNLKLMCPSKEKRDLILIAKDLYVYGQNQDYFALKDMRLVKHKNYSYMLYVFKNLKTGKGCGYYISKEREVISFHLKGYKINTPFNDISKLICRDVLDALFKTGEVN